MITPFQIFPECYDHPEQSFFCRDDATVNIVRNGYFFGEDGIGIEDFYCACNCFGYGISDDNVQGIQQQHVDGHYRLFERYGCDGKIINSWEYENYYIYKKSAYSLDMHQDRYENRAKEIGNTTTKVIPV